ncbi:hypothetical protein [Archangium sp.]|uniref:hypothetical protein n=1 Tax=Archangium sp. TaxID=1872627 RepID=UPI00286C8791|nr:hypothetical protein [Archangium sp.]
MKVEVIGVYPVDEAHETCHLIELLVEGEGEFEVGSINQPDPSRPTLDWQVPYDEYRLAPEGDSGEPLDLRHAVDLHGQIRLAFYFHYLSPAEPLWTPAGPVALPPVTPMPGRLRFMKYEPPC